jgi:hypothetical protein
MHYTRALSWLIMYEYIYTHAHTHIHTHTHTVVETSQQGHIMSEKQALMTLKHPFLVMMMATYKSKDYLYFLLEPGACDVVRCMCVCMFSNNFSKHDFTYTHPLTTHAHTHSSSLFLSLSLSLSHTHTQRSPGWGALHPPAQEQYVLSERRALLRCIGGARLRVHAPEGDRVSRSEAR